MGIAVPRSQGARRRRQKSGGNLRESTGKSGDVQPMFEAVCMVFMVDLELAKMMG